MISNVRNILETTEEEGIFFSKKREQQSPPKPAESQRQNCNLNFVTGSNLPFGHENLRFLKCRGHFPVTFICTAKAHIVSEFATPNLHHIVQLEASLSLKKLLHLKDLLKTKPTIFAGLSILEKFHTSGTCTLIRGLGRRHQTQVGAATIINSTWVCSC